MLHYSDIGGVVGRKTFSSDTRLGSVDLQVNVVGPTTDTELGLAVNVAPYFGPVIEDLADFHLVAVSHCLLGVALWQSVGYFVISFLEFEA